MEHVHKILHFRRKKQLITHLMISDAREFFEFAMILFDRLQTLYNRISHHCVLLVLFQEYK